MLNVIRRLLSNPVGAVSSGVHTLINAGLSALASLVDTVFGNVTGAWGDLAQWFESLPAALAHLNTWLYAHLRQLVTHDIPVYAQGAYWWVTHPGDLANLLFWHLVRSLENQAWTAAEYLGEFIVALIARNALRVARLAETILAAVL